jgi:hypothetical protein
MKCKSCGEEVNFRLIRITAKWNGEKQDWDREVFESSEEEVMCFTCNSFDVRPKPM